MPFRTDRGTLKAPRRLDDGRLIVDGVLTRTGVFSYRNDDGSERLEYRPPGEVFNTDSMASFALVPVTDDHPTGMVTSESAKAVAVGTVGESVRQDNDLMIAPLAINDAGTIAKVDSGKTQLSCGYTCDLEFAPGISPEGKRFDAIQRNIRGNHVALVEVGRAGPEARIRMDDAAHQTQPRDQSMEPKLIETLEKLAVEKARADKAEADLAAANARADKAEAERDVAQEAQTKSDKARTDAAEKFDAAVAARVQLEGVAKQVLPDLDCTGKSDLEVKAAVAKIDAEGKSPDYVQARYDMAIENLDEEAEGEKIYAGKKRAPKADAVDENSSEAAYERMCERNRNAYKQEA